MQAKRNGIPLPTTEIKPQRLAVLLLEYQQAVRCLAQASELAGEQAGTSTIQDHGLTDKVRGELTALLGLTDWFAAQGWALQPKVRYGLRRMHFYLHGSHSVRMVLDGNPLYLDAEEQEAGLVYHAYACVNQFIDDVTGQRHYEFEGIVLHDSLYQAPGSAGLLFTGRLISDLPTALMLLRRQAPPTPSRACNWLCRFRQRREWHSIMRNAFDNARETDPAMRQRLDALTPLARSDSRVFRKRQALAGALLLLMAIIVVGSVMIWRYLPPSNATPWITAVLRHASMATNSNAAELESSLAQEESVGQLLKLLAGEPLPADPHGTPLTDENVSLRAYTNPDNRVEVLVVRGTIVDGYQLVNSPGGQVAIKHWVIDLWDAAQNCVGPEEVDQARKYFTEQERQTLAMEKKLDVCRKSPSEWSFFSPGGHAKLHPAVDFDNDGHLEYPVSMMATLHFLSADGKLEASWAAPQQLSGWIYDDAQFYDLDGDQRTEALLSVATGYLCQIPGISNDRGLVVCSATGKVQHKLALPQYPLLSPVGEYTASGNPEIILTCDVPGNGYRATVEYRGQQLELTDQNGMLALVSFDGLQPVLEWLAQPPEFVVPWGSAVKWLKQKPGESQWFCVLHHSGDGGIEPYDELYMLDRPGLARIAAGGKTAPQRFPRVNANQIVGIPEVVRGTEPASFLFCRPPQSGKPAAIVLEGADLGANPLHAIDLPQGYRQPVLSVFPNGAGGLLALAWDTAGACEPKLFSAIDNSLLEVKPIPHAIWEQPVHSVTSIPTAPGKVLLLVLSDRLEFWELEWNSQR